MDSTLIKSIRNSYENIYKKYEIIPKDKHLYNLYKLNNSAGMIILGRLILFENEIKSKLNELLLNKFKDFKKLNSNLESICGSDKRLLNGIKKMIEKNKIKDIDSFSKNLMFSQIIVLINKINLSKIFRSFTEMSSYYERLIYDIKAYRNLLAHGNQLTKEVRTGSYINKLSRVIKYLFKRYPDLRNELTELLLHYDENKIGIEKAKLLSSLGVIGLFGLIKNKINNRKELYDFYIGYNYKKILSGNLAVMSEFPNLFGSVKFKKTYNKDSREKIIINKNYIRWYKKYLESKIENENVTSFERLILRILWISEKQKITMEKIRNILETSISDKDVIVKICKTFKILIIKNIKKNDPKQLVINRMLFNNFKMYKKNYLINKKMEIYKITNLYPYIKSVAKSIRKNNKNNVHLQVSINGKGEALHKIIANLFLSNPKKYKYLGAKNGNFVDFTLSKLTWIKYPAKPAVDSSLRKQNNVKIKK